MRKAAPMLGRGIRALHIDGTLAGNGVQSGDDASVRVRGTVIKIQKHAYKRFKVARN